MSAASVVQVVSARLDYLLHEETYGIDLRNMIEQLRSDLDVIEQFLLTSKANNLNKQVIQLAYDIENAVERHILREHISSGAGGFKSIFNLCSGKNNVDDVHNLKKRIDELKLVCVLTDDKSTALIDEEVQQDQNPTHVTISESGSSSRGGPEINRIDSSINNNIMGEGIRELLSILLGENVVKTNIITITGMGGIGKTILAEKVFYDKAVVQYFDCRAWVTVGQVFSARDVLVEILGSPLFGDRKSTKEKISQMETLELMEKLYKVQKGRKCLIVLDDLWSLDAWDSMRVAFSSGTKIIITSRVDSLAGLLGGHVYTTQHLSDDSSWELFKEKSGLKDSDIRNNPHAKDIVRKLIKDCQGLPSAIVLISSLLKKTKLEDWDKVTLFEERKSEEQKISEILSLSYDHLPLHLKPCLLYMRLFPEDELILTDKLYSMWMAEGLIASTARSPSHEDLLNIAKEFLRDLIDRSFVQIVEYDQESNIKEIKSCQIHDLIREFLIAKAKEYIPESKQVRTLLIFGNAKSRWPLDVADFYDFQWTRVLNFDGVDFWVVNHKLPMSLDKLLYLRYLSFRDCYLEELKLSFTNFLYLETLDLRVVTSCKLIIPNVLWKLTNLRQLYFPLKFQSGDEKKLELDGLTKLEVVENFCVGICNGGDFQQFKRLQIFKVLFKDGDTREMNKIIEFINGHVYLRNTSLVLEKFDCYSKARQSLLENMLTSHAIHSLHIEGHLRRMPKDLIIGENFTEMVLDGCEFREDPMPILGRVQQLKTLTLCNDAIVGNKIVCPESSFEELTSLKLANLQHLDNWELDSTAMTNIVSLTIEQCDKLHMLPYELTDIISLADLHIGSMSEIFNGKVRELLEERESYGNDDLISNFYKCN